MTAKAVMKEASVVGVQLRLDGEKLAMKAAAKPPDELLTKIKEHKAEIVALMRSKQFLAAVQTIWPEARTLRPNGPKTLNSANRSSLFERTTPEFTRDHTRGLSNDFSKHYAR
jgi:hypothetical protein